MEAAVGMSMLVVVLLGLLLVVVVVVGRRGGGCGHGGQRVRQAEVPPFARAMLWREGWEEFFDVRGGCGGGFVAEGGFWNG
ncbi:hypothetical protein HDK77DRAFT_444718 [Phyllosticta capitalensis]